MKSDFELIKHSFKGKELKIYPISDVHLGAAEHYSEEWKKFVDKIKSEPNSRIILGGDLLNNSTRNSVSNIFEETMRPREQKILMTEMLYPLKNKILCAVSGNHERRSGKDADDDPMYDIMCKLDLEDLYRENTAFVKINSTPDNKRRGAYTPSYVLCVTHGSGGGALTGSAVNKAERFGYVMDGVDALIVGHTHKPFVTQPSKIKVESRSETVSIVPFKVVSMTSWLGYGGYAAQKMLNPSGFAPQTIILSGATFKKLSVEM